MRPTTHGLIVAAFALLATFTPFSAQSQNKIAPPKPAASISGKVSIKDKGAPGIIVGIRRADPMNPFELLSRATTDQDGNYRITNIPPGRFDVAPAPSAYIVADYNNSRSKNVVVGEGEDIEGIDFSLVRGAVITGRVTDANGHPVIQEQVRIYRAESFDQGRPQQPAQIYPATTTTTDDRGIYRIFGLASGRYKVAAGRSDETFSGSIMVSRISYNQVFHPDVSDQAKATVIEVSEGGEATGVDIALGRVAETFNAAGRVVDGDTGLPVPNLRFGLQRIVGNRTEYVNSLVSTNGQGSFVAENLIPGKYGVFLMSEPNSEGRIESMTFEILDQDISGLTVRLVKGASVSGVIVLETTDTHALQKLTQVQMQGYVANPGIGGGMGQSATSTIGPDASFRLAGLPAGMLNLRLSGVFGSDQGKGLAISRIERDGLVQPRAFEIREGEQITGIRVFASYGTATLRGVVNIENGTLPTGGFIYVRMNKVGETSTTIQSSRADARGHFLFEDLAAGDYDVFIMVLGTNARRPSPAKQVVSVQDGVVTDIVLTLDLGSKQ